MQLKHALLPVAVLAISGIFLAKRQFASTEKQHSMAIYRETIRTVTEHRAGTRVRLAAEAEQKKNSSAPVATRESIDLKEIARAMAGMRGGGFPDMQAMVKMQKAVMGLSVEDLSSLIADASKMDLPDEQKIGLQTMLLQGLVQKDAKAAVLAGQSLMGEIAGNQKMMVNMSVVRPAFSEWLKQDAGAALQWFDSEVTAGHFENKSLQDVNNERMQFEGALLPSLAAKDPAAAKDRLLKLTPGERVAALSAGDGFRTDSASQRAFSDLVRGTLDPAQQAGVLSNLASSIQAASDFKGVGDYLSSIGATPEEKSKILPGVATSSLRNLAWGSDKSLTYENALPVKNWLEEQQPGSSGKILGESLASVSGMGRYSTEDAIKLLDRFYGESPSDDLLTSFISHSRAGTKAEELRALAAKIQDPGQLREALDTIGQRK